MEQNNSDNNSDNNNKPTNYVHDMFKQHVGEPLNNASQPLKDKFTGGAEDQQPKQEPEEQPVQEQGPQEKGPEGQSVQEQEPQEKGNMLANLKGKFNAASSLFKGKDNSDDKGSSPEIKQEKPEGQQTPELAKKQVKKITEELCTQLKNNSTQIGENIEAMILQNVDWNKYGNDLVGILSNKINTRLENIKFMITSTDNENPQPPIGSIAPSTGSTNTNRQSKPPAASPSASPSAPTSAPTSASTSAPTSASTSAPTSASSGSNEVVGPKPEDIEVVTLPDGVEERAIANGHNEDEAKKIDTGITSFGDISDTEKNIILKKLTELDNNDNNFNEKGKELASSIIDSYIELDTLMKSTIMNPLYNQKLENYDEFIEKFDKLIEEKFPEDKQTLTDGDGNDDGNGNGNVNDDGDGNGNGNGNVNDDGNGNDNGNGNGVEVMGGNDNNDNNNDKNNNNDNNNNNNNNNDDTGDNTADDSNTVLTNGQNFMKGFLDEIETNEKIKYDDTITKFKIMNLLLPPLIDDDNKMKKYQNLFTEKDITKFNKYNATTNFGNTSKYDYDKYRLSDVQINAFNDANFTDDNDDIQKKLKEIFPDNCENDKFNKLQCLISFINKFIKDEEYEASNSVYNYTHLSKYKEKFDEKNKNEPNYYNDEQKKKMNELFDLLNNVHTTDPNYKESEEDENKKYKILLSVRDTRAGQLKNMASNGLAVLGNRLFRPVLAIKQFVTNDGFFSENNKSYYNPFQTSLFKTLFEFFEKEKYCNKNYKEGVLILHDIFQLRNTNLEKIAAKSKNAKATASSAASSLKSAASSAKDVFGNIASKFTKDKNKSQETGSSWWKNGGSSNKTKRIQYISNNKTRRKLG